jgi:urea-proton symporter
MYDLLLDAQQRNNYSAATKDGSYLTVRSLPALKFAILSIVEYTGVVFLGGFLSCTTIAGPFLSCG